MKNTRIIPGILALALLLTGCGARVSAPSAPELLPAAGVASDIACAFIGDNHVIKTVDACVSPYVEELCLPINGVVDEVLARPGDRVKKGDRILTLDLDSERERAEKLEKDIAYARTVNDFDNQMAEIDLRVLMTELEYLRARDADKTEIDLKALSVEQARLRIAQTKELQSLDLSAKEAELEKIRASLECDAVYAPFDGVIAREIELARGSRVRAYETLAYLADDTRLRITASYIPESTILTATGGYYALIGDGRYEIEYVPIEKEAFLSLMLSGNPITSEFRIVGPDGWESRLEAGQYAAIMLVNSYSPDALLIPANAVLSDSGGKYVYVVGENGQRIKRNIKTRQPVGAIYAQVLEGLSEGEQIYVTDK